MSTSLSAHPNSSSSAIESSMKNSLAHFASLAKPGIIFGNAISVVAGYFLGLSGDLSALHLIMTLVGISLVIAGGGAYNNVIDRDIDALMERTKNRPMVNNLIPIPMALTFATLMSLLGLGILYFFTNILTAFSAIFGLFVYVVVYSIWMKRSSIHATIVGSLSGAAPPLVGYAAVANTIDLPIILLFAALCLWQMPHSYAIGFFRASEFKAAKIPLLPLLKSADISKKVMLAYGLAFLAAAVSIYFLGFAGIVYLIIVGIGALAWVGSIGQGFRSHDEEHDRIWARKVFLGSIIMVTMMSVALIFDRQV